MDNMGHMKGHSQKGHSNKGFIIGPSAARILVSVVATSGPAFEILDFMETHRSSFGGTMQGLKTMGN